MDYNLVREVRFFSGEVYKDITNVSQGIVMADKEKKMDHWEIYSVYVISAIITCLAFRSMLCSPDHIPEVKISELKAKLEQPADKIKEFILMSAVSIPLSAYLSKDEYEKIDEAIKNFLKAQPKESESIVKSANKYLDWFISDYNITL